MNPQMIGFRLLFGVVGAIVGGFVSADAVEPTARDTKGLLVLYTFEGPGDDVIRDRSGVGEPLDLRIESPRAVSWRDGRVVITSSARIASQQPARKIVSAIKQSQAVTIEAWLKPQDLRQSGPARIVSLSGDTGRRNFTLGQNLGQYDVRLRTRATDANGNPSTMTAKDSLRGTHPRRLHSRSRRVGADLCERTATSRGAADRRFVDLERGLPPGAGQRNDGRSTVARRIAARRHLRPGSIGRRCRGTFAPARPPRLISPLCCHRPRRDAWTSCGISNRCCGGTVSTVMPPAMKKGD